jgi:hypothetical protein
LSSYSRGLWAWLVGAGAFGCSWIVPSSSDLTGGATGTIDEADATMNDGASIVDVVGVDASDDDSGAPPALYTWSFDLGCSGWTPHRSVLATETALASSPPGACKICASAGANDDFGMFIPLPSTLPTDEVLIVEARGRAEPGGGAMTLKVTLYTSVDDGMSGTNEVGEAYGSSATSKKAPPGTTLYIKGASPGSSPCLIVDDVVVRRDP